MSQQEYRIISLNVHGLQNPIKRSKLIAKMKREDQHIIFWQETHLVRTEHEKLRKLGFRNTFYSSYTKGHARGVEILISNKVTFQVSSQIADKEGRYILVKGILDSKEVTLLNVYRPPRKDKLLITKTFDLITSEVSGTLICGGDWNVQLQPTLDSSNPAKKINSESLYVKKKCLRKLAWLTYGGNSTQVRGSLHFSLTLIQSIQGLIIFSCSNRTGIEL